MNRHRWGLLLILAVPLIPLSAYAQKAQEPACYRLIRGPWTPLITEGEDSVLHTPPPLALLTWFPRPDYGKGWYVALGYSMGDSLVAFLGSQFGGWRPIPGDSIKLSFGDGFEGVLITLAVAPDTLRGRMVNTRDYSSPEDFPRAPIIALPATCPTVE